MGNSGIRCNSKFLILNSYSVIGPVRPDSRRAKGRLDVRPQPCLQLGRGIPFFSLFLPQSSQFLQADAHRARSPGSLLDLGPCRRHNVAFSAEQLGCKSFFEDIFASRSPLSAGQARQAPEFLKKAVLFPQADCVGRCHPVWDLIDYLIALPPKRGEPSHRVLRPAGALRAAFAAAPRRRLALQHKPSSCIIPVDETNLKHRSKRPLHAGRRQPPDATCIRRSPACASSVFPADEQAHRDRCCSATLLEAVSLSRYRNTDRARSTTFIGGTPSLYLLIGSVMCVPRRCREHHQGTP